MDEDVRRMVKTTDATKKKLPWERLKSVFLIGRRRSGREGGKGGASENSGKRKGRPTFGGFERNDGEWDGTRRANVARGDAWKNEDQVGEQRTFHPTNHTHLVALRGKRRC